MGSKYRSFERSFALPARLPFKLMKTNIIFSIIFFLLALAGASTVGTGKVFGSTFDSVVFTICCFIASYTFRLSYTPAWGEDPTKP